MRAKITYFVLAAVLVFVLRPGRQPGRAAAHPASRPLTVAFGVAVLMLPVHRRLVPLAEHPVRPQRQPAGRASWRPRAACRSTSWTRTPGGRIDRDSADEVFARRQAETEDAPDDWRCWFRLAVAYHDARDTPRARKAMQRAIALHDGRPVRPTRPTGSSERVTGRAARPGRARAGRASGAAPRERRGPGQRRGTPPPRPRSRRAARSNASAATGSPRCGR